MVYRCTGVGVQAAPLLASVAQVTSIAASVARVPRPGQAGGLQGIHGNIHWLLPPGNFAPTLIKTFG